MQLPTGVSPDLTMDALYAFTDCEISISPNTCVIIDDKPRFVGVEDVLRQSTRATVRLLERELEIRQDELHEKWHSASLEKIFIENRIYRKIEECETWADILETIEKGLNSLPARGRTLGDSLAAAKAYGYTPETAIRVRGPGDPDATDEHDYLNSLRGPGGERVSWLRLGSCCEFSTPNGLDGRAGMMDAYEVTYPGQAAPVTLYLNMYDPPNSAEVPHGFTRVTPGPPST